MVSFQSRGLGWGLGSWVYSEGLYQAMGASFVRIMATARKTDEIICDLMSCVLLGEEAPRSCWEQQTEEEKRKKGKRQPGKTELKIGDSLIMYMYFYLTFPN